jgi:hypothetical protein
LIYWVNLNENHWFLKIWQKVYKGTVESADQIFYNAPFDSLKNGHYTKNCLHFLLLHLQLNLCVKVELSERLLFNAKSAIFFAISWQEQVPFWWDNDDVCSELDQHSYLDFYSKLKEPVLFISSPGPKVHVNYCHHLASVVCRLSSVHFSHFKLLLRNHLADWNRT